MIRIFAGVVDCLLAMIHVNAGYALDLYATVADLPRLSICFFEGIRSASHLLGHRWSKLSMILLVAIIAKVCLGGQMH